MLVAAAIAEAGTDAQKKRWLPAIATGDARADRRPCSTPISTGARTRSRRAPRRRRPAGSCPASSATSPWGHVADVLLIPARTPEGVSLFLVDPAAAGPDAGRPCMSMDPGTRLADLDARPRARPRARTCWARPARPPRVLARLLRRGAVGAAAEMLGAARRCLDMAVGYAKVREQFGQPIGSFQAIRHKCAEMLLEVENSHSAVYYAAWALDADAEDADLAASVAKAYVGDASRKVCGEAIQVHGGIGFTWEYDLHMYFKRAKALEAQYGDADYHRELIVRHAAR